MSKVAAVLVATILMVIGLVPPAYALTNTEYEGRVRAIINTYHVPDLNRGGCADYFAERHAKRLDLNDAFYHQDMGPLLRVCNANAAGEIIARGHATPREVVNAWLDSDGHREVMLKQKWDVIGVGTRNTPHGKLTVVTFLDK